MNRDGHIDYGSYDLDQLRAALSVVDRKRYPLNYQRIQVEIGVRLADDGSSRGATTTVVPSTPEEPLWPEKQLSTRTSSKWAVVTRYTLLMFVASVALGILTAIVRHLLGDAEHAWGVFDSGMVQRLIELLVVSSLVYGRLAIRHASTYFSVATAVAVATGILSFLCALWLAPNGKTIHFLFMIPAIAAHVALALSLGVIYRALFPEWKIGAEGAPNKTMQPTCEDARG